MYRPIGREEFALLEESGWIRWPPRLPEQPIFYPVLHARYAQQIAQDWNAKDNEKGFVTRFRVKADVAKRYPIQIVGASWHQELWVPAGELEAFNRGIVGNIEVIAEFEDK